VKTLKEKIDILARMLVTPWTANHKFGKQISEQSCYVETIEVLWEAFLVIKLDSPSRGKIRGLEQSLEA
jgi:hypothetical protein